MSNNKENCGCNNKENCGCNNKDKLILGKDCQPCIVPCGDPTPFLIPEGVAEYSANGSLTGQVAHKYNPVTMRYEAEQKSKCCFTPSVITPLPLWERSLDTISVSTQGFAVCPDPCELKAWELAQYRATVPTAFAPIPAVPEMYETEADALAGIPILMVLDNLGKPVLDSYGNPVPVLSNGQLVKKPANPLFVVNYGQSAFIITSFSLGLTPTTGVINNPVKTALNETNKVSMEKCDDGHCKTC